MRLKEDLRSFANNEGIRKVIVTIFTNPCFHSVCLFRLSSLLHKLQLSFFAKIVWYFNRVIFSVDIDYRADLAGGFKLVHGLGTVIGMNVRSLGRLTVYQGVTIGGNFGKTQIFIDGNQFDQPIFYDNVVVFTGAKIFGPVVISENMIVKAGSIITEDIQKNASTKV